jgi:hypothetical protein
LATHHYYRGGEFERSGEHWFGIANTPALLIAFLLGR